MADFEDDSPEEKKKLAKAKRGKRWANRIEDALKVESDWRRYATETVKRYREEDANAREQPSAKGVGARFNILFSNIAVTRPSIFQHAPTPTAKRRYEPKGFDPETTLAMRTAGAQASEIIQRVLTTQMDIHGYSDEIDLVSMDALLTGRGIMRVRYVPEITSVPTDETDDDGKTINEEQLTGQSVFIEHVYWEDFVVAPGRKWTKKTPPEWLAFRHIFTRAQLERHFPGHDPKSIPLTFTQDKGDDKEAHGSISDRAEVYEIWDRISRKIIWLSNADIIESNDNELGLEDFFPVAPPFYAIKTSNTRVPVAEFKVYSDLANELDIITERISILTSHLKVKGIYDSTMTAVGKLLESNRDGHMIPADNFAAFEGRKIEDALMFMPLDHIVTVLSALYLNRDQTKAVIYEVIGIADILRGQSNASETLGAQKIKTRFGTLRIDERRRILDNIQRDALRIKAEIIAEKFEKSILEPMTSMKIDDQTMQLLRAENIRSYIIDIETDSTIAADELAEQEIMVKLVTAITQFLTGVVPMVQGQLIAPEDAMKLLRAFLHPFRGARNFEEVFDDAERRLQESPPQQQEEGPSEEDQLKVQKAQVGLETAVVKKDAAAEKGVIDIEIARANKDNG